MRVDGLHDFLTGEDFSGVVLLRRGDDTVFEGAYGLASPRWGVANAMDTRFDTASITKLFTSVAVLQLVGRGGLDLDTSIHTYADLSGTTISSEVTLRHLLTHTSGIADDADEEAGEDYAELWVDRPSYSVMTSRDFLPQFAHKEPLASPGEQCRYCNVGYVLAGLADRVRKRTELPRLRRRRDLQQGRDGRLRLLRPPGRRTQRRRGVRPRRSRAPGAEHLQVPADRLTRRRRPRHRRRPGSLHRGDEGWRAAAGRPDPALLHAAGPPRREIEYGFGLEFRGPDWWKRGSNAGVSGIVKHYGEHSVDAVVLSNTQDGAWSVVHELDRLALG